MKDRLRTIRLRLVAMVVVAAVAGLAASAHAAPGAAARLSVRSTEYGKALFGPSGKVVYVFGADRGSTSHCYGVCAKAWPPVLTTAAPSAGPAVETKLVGTTKRKNGTLRQWCKRLTRLTYAFSKKWDSLKAALALHFAHYNFCRVHGSLRITPAMAAGIADRVWELTDLLA